MCEPNAGILFTVPGIRSSGSSNGTFAKVGTCSVGELSAVGTWYGKLSALNFSLILAPGILRTLQLNSKAPHLQFSRSVHTPR